MPIKSGWSTQKSFSPSSFGSNLKCSLASAATACVFSQTSVTLNTHLACHDTDGDGIPDGAEVAQGTDPLDGLPARTGIIATASTPGTAVDVCALNDLAIVAEGAAGVTVFNVFSGMNPVGIIQVDTPGNAQRVACSGSLVAVADGPASLAIIDISDPPNARIIHQVALSGSAQAVTAAGGIAYVGTDSGQIAAVDLASGTVLASASVPGAVQDIGLGGDYLYVLRTDTLHTFAIADGDLQQISSVPSPTFAAGNRRLFVGDTFAYAVQNKGANAFSLANPAAPALVSTANTTEFGWKQFVPNGSGLALATDDPNLALDGPNDLSLYDLSDPANTQKFLTKFSTPGIAFSVSIYNGLAYVADGDAGLQVVNYLTYDSKGVPPTISLLPSFPMTTSTNGITEEGKLVRVIANVTDDVQVRNVEFYVDGVKVATDGNFPFEYRFVTPRKSATQTNFLVRAKATDTGGNSAWSEEVTVALVPDATPPQVKQIQPIDETVVTNATAVFVFFNEPIDTTTLTAANLFLLSAGPDGRVGTPDDFVIANAVIGYRDTLNAAALQFPAPLPPGVYRLVMNPVVRDLAGNVTTNSVSATFGVFPSGPDGDEDNDDLTNLEEIHHGTNPFQADSDGDGWIDSLEVNDGTDPWDASSKPQSTYLAAPLLQIELPSPETYGSAGSPTVLARPPLTIDFPSSETYGTSGTALHLAKPPVSVKISP